jgi:hypothetical protein
MTLSLAQILPETPNIPPLPAPPLWERALLEQPGYLALFLLLAGIVVFILLNQRGKPRQGAAAATGLVLASIGVMLLGMMVQTEREQMADATRTLVDVTARNDTAALGEMLAPDARLFAGMPIPEVAAVPSAGLDRDGILRAVNTALTREPLKEARVTRVQAERLSPGAGRTQATVRVVVERYAVPNTSVWRLNWRRSSDGRWRITQIEPVYVTRFGPPR